VDEQTGSQHAVLCIGGLLRYREIEPFTLVAASSREARALPNRLRAILAAPEAARASPKLRWLIEDCLSALEGDPGGRRLLIDAEEL
jgi:hypothetical protein